MNELEIFKEHISKRVDFLPEELEEITAAFVLKKIKKKQYIIQPEFVAKYRTYVVKGAFRSYVIDPEGADHTIQFAIDDWWISDYNSYVYQKPATLFVEALEDSVVFQLDFVTEQGLKKKHHNFETFFRVAAERSAAFHQRRIVSALTLTAEERYHEFVDAYPAVVQRLPQYALASYLGMTTQTLSKIRNTRKLI
jgi:CRP-like cAMP-binding protein